MPVIDEAELAALHELDEARRACEPIEPDRWEGSGSSTVGIVTARRQAEAVDPNLEAAGIVIECRGSKPIGSGLAVSFGWRHKGWRSETETIYVEIERRDRSASAASKAAHTTARKIYVEQLLGLKVAADDETALAVSHDRARDAVRGACERLLNAYCRKTGYSPARVIEQLLGLRSMGADWTFEMLVPIQVTQLCWHLQARLGDEASVKHNPGAPVRLAADDDLPPEMGGQEVAHA